MTTTVQLHNIPNCHSLSHRQAIGASPSIAARPLHHLHQCDALARPGRALEVHVRRCPAADGLLQLLGATPPHEAAAVREGQLCLQGPAASLALLLRGARGVEGLQHRIRDGAADLWLSEP